MSIFSNICWFHIFVWPVLTRSDAVTTSSPMLELPMIDTVRHNWALRSGGSDVIVVFNRDLPSPFKSLNVKLILQIVDSVRNETVKYQESSNDSDFYIEETTQDSNDGGIQVLQSPCRMGQNKREVLCLAPNITPFFPNFTADNVEPSLNPIAAEPVQFDGCNRTSPGLCYGIQVDGRYPALRRMPRMKPTTDRPLAFQNGPDSSVLAERRRSYTLFYYADPVVASANLLQPGNLLSISGIGFNVLPVFQGIMPDFSLFAYVSKDRQIEILCNVTYKNANEDGFNCVFEESQLLPYVMKTQPVDITAQYGNWNGSSRLINEIKRPFPIPRPGFIHADDNRGPSNDMRRRQDQNSTSNDGYRWGGQWFPNPSANRFPTDDRPNNFNPQDNNRMMPFPQGPQRPMGPLGGPQGQQGPQSPMNRFRPLEDENSTSDDRGRWPMAPFRGDRRGDPRSPPHERDRDENRTVWVKFDEKRYNSTEGPFRNASEFVKILVPIGTAALLIIACVALVCCLRRTRLRSTKLFQVIFPNRPLEKKDSVKVPQRFSLDLLPPETVETLEKHRIDKCRLIIGNELGEGHFGIVKSAIIYPTRHRNELSVTLSNPERKIEPKIDEANIPQKVAVKTIQRYENLATIREFFEEAIVMFSFNHPNVLSAIGFVNDLDSFPAIVLPFMDRGNLHTYVRTSEDFNSTMLFDFAWQIAKGMAYLAELKIIHRDLAARNCLLNKKLVVKVSDFGLSRMSGSSNYDCYGVPQYEMLSQHRLLPIRWLAPECIEDKIFTEKSDVWSYGVLLWELATRGERPYGDLESSKVISFIRDEDGRLAQPPDLAPELYEVMLQCWHKHSSSRPTFAQLAINIRSLIDELSQGDYCDPHLTATISLKKPLEKTSSLDSQTTSVHSSVTKVTSVTSSLMDPASLAESQPCYSDILDHSNSSGCNSSVSSLENTASSYYKQLP